MKQERILEAIGNIKDQYIEEANENVKDFALEAKNSKTEKGLRGKEEHRRSWIRYGSIAACFCVAVLGTVLMLKLSGNYSVDDVRQDYTNTLEDDNHAETTNPSDNTNLSGNINSVESAEQGKENLTIGGACDFYGDGTSDQYVPMISDYDTDVTGCYALPENGTVNLTVPLRKAMEEYTDTVRYRVIIHMFCNEAPLQNDSRLVEEEMERLSAAGYITALETYSDGENESYTLTIHASEAQITNFPPKEEYGYMLFLYGELFDNPEGEDTKDNVNFSSEDVPVDETTYHEAEDYPEDIMQLQSVISQAMSNGELDFVISSSIMENPLRLEVCVTTQEEEKLALLRKYDSEGKYLVIVSGSGQSHNDLVVEKR